MLKAAYDSCVDSKAKLSMPYINKILESWHQKGFKTAEETKAKPKTTENFENKPSYDLDLFEKMINTKD